MVSKLDSLYMAVGRTIQKHPHHQGRLKMLIDPTQQPYVWRCNLKLSVKFDENDRVEDIAFVNSGCLDLNGFS